MDKEFEEKIQQEFYSCYGIPPELFTEESPIKRSIEIQENTFKEKYMRIKLEL